MVLDKQAQKYRALDDWFKTPQGVRLSHAFASELKIISNMMRGTQLVQLGHCGDNLWLPALRFQHKWLVSPCNEQRSSALVSSLNALPIARSSIDCVIAPLTMEAFADDKSPIDEIDRILKPMGYAVFFGINPWSFWGAALRLKLIPCFGQASGGVLSPFSLKNALLNRGYTQCTWSSFYYIPPVSSKALISRLEFFNQMGKMIGPFPAGFYCFVAQKYQPISPSLAFEPFVSQLINLVPN